MRVLLILLALAQTNRLPIRGQITLVESGTFHLSCDAGEISGTTNGSTVTPTYTAGSTGTLVVAGTGGVVFNAVQIGNGVSFLDGNQQNTNISYYKFTGATIGNVWLAEAGRADFYLRSSYSWEARQALTDDSKKRYVYDVYDGTGAMFNFVVTIFPGSPNRLKIIWGQDRSGTEYDIPSGEEDTYFGNGVILKVKVTWDGTNHAADQGIARLYLNDVLAQSFVYTYSAPNWTAGSLFYIGTQGTPGSVGYFGLDDKLDELRIH